MRLAMRAWLISLPTYALHTRRTGCARCSSQPAQSVRGLAHSLASVQEYTLMGLFGSKAVVWVPENEKLKEKCLDAESWDAKESFVGWRVQNDGKMLMQAVGKCESCSNFDFSYNGLGDREAEALGLALKKNYSSNDKPFAGVKGAKMYGTITKLNLSNNNIHALGIKAIMNAITSPDPSRKLFALEDINLSNNSAGHEGAEAVANVMSGNRILKKINLSWNNIGNAGLKAIIQAFSNQHARGKIVIAYNQFDLDELDFREWFGSDPTPPAKLARICGHCQYDEVLPGWTEAGLDHVVPA